jgi:hypothetical protein
MVQISKYSIALVAWSLLSQGTAHAQFTTIINVPPQVAPTAVDSDTQVNLFDGGAIGERFFVGSANPPKSNIEVNVHGGSVGQLFEAHSGSTVNVLGGLIGRDFRAFAGSRINVSGGYISPGFVVYNGSVLRINGGFVESQLSVEHGAQVDISAGEVRSMSSQPTSKVSISGGSINGLTTSGTVNLTGGAIGALSTFAGGQVTISGGDFRVNGNVIDGLASIRSSVPFNFSWRDVLSGTLSDGTSFAFFADDRDDFAPGTITLTAAATPPIGPALITVPIDPVPPGLRQGQTLVVDDGGVVDGIFNAGWGSTVNVKLGGKMSLPFNAISSHVNVSGGTINALYAHAGSEVNISSGTVGSVLAHGGSFVDVTGGTVHFVDVINGSNLNFSGGSLTGGFGAHAGSTANMFNGSAGNSVRAFAGGTINIFGGSIGDNFQAYANSEVNIKDGAFGNRFKAEFDSAVDIAGGSFGDYFEARAGSMVTLRGSGFRIDGVPISGLANIGDSASVDIPNGAVLSGVFADGTPFAFKPTSFLLSPFDEDIIAPGSLRLVAAQLPAIGPTQITASIDEIPLGIREGQLLIVDNGGNVRKNFLAGRGGAVRVLEGGMIGDNMEAVGATVDVLGGSIGDAFDAFSGGVVNMHDGSIGTSFSAHSGSIVNVFGGTVGDLFNALSGSSVNLYGTQFMFDGVPIAGLVPGNPFVLSQRGGMLTGRLANGDQFRISLLKFGRSHPVDLIAPDALLTLTLVPEPSSVLLSLIGLILIIFSLRYRR